MTCINVIEFVLISYLEKNHSMIETCRSKNVVTFNLYLHLYLQIYILSLVLTVDPKKKLGLMQITKEIV